jgi:hypothetical protein
MDVILSDRRGALKVADAAISDTLFRCRLLTTLPVAMTSWDSSQKNGTAINTPEGADSVAFALRSLANRAKLRLNWWVRAPAKFPEDPARYS